MTWIQLESFETTTWSDWNTLRNLLAQVAPDFLRFFASLALASRHGDSATVMQMNDQQSRE